MVTCNKTIAQNGLNDFDCKKVFPSNAPTMVDALAVAAPDGLKNETFWTDLRILINHAAERTTATAATIVISVTISDA